MTCTETPSPRLPEIAAPRSNDGADPDAPDGLLQSDQVYQHLVDALQQRDRRIENLEVALHSNRTIGVAIGILMAGLKCPRDEAFSGLVIASNNLNLKLAAVAEYVEQTGTLPDPKGVRGTRPGKR